MSPVDRPCGECQACCWALAVRPNNDVDEAPLSPSRHPCPFQCPEGCSIYAERPDPCAAYRCMWKLGWGGDDDRPDQLGLILEADRRMRALCTVSEVREGAAEEERGVMALIAIRFSCPVTLINRFDGSWALFHPSKATRDHFDPLPTPFTAIMLDPPPEGLWTD